MSYNAIVYRILIASPSDIIEDIGILKEVISNWNQANSYNEKIILEPVKWETHANPEMGEDPQAIINKQLVKNCDILIGAFWTRIGTPTSRAVSGTVEEINEFTSSGRPVMLYFSKAPADLDKVNLDQYNKLLEFKEYCRKKGLVFEYENPHNLKELFGQHLIRKIHEVKSSIKKNIVVKADGSQVKIPQTKEETIRSMAVSFDVTIKDFEFEWRTFRDVMHDQRGAEVHMLHLRNYLVQFRKELFYDSKLCEEGTDLDGLISLCIRHAKFLEDYGRNTNNIRGFFEGDADESKFWKDGDTLFNNLKGIPSILASSV